MSCNKIKYKKILLSEQIPKYNRKITETGNIDTPNTHIRARSLSWLAQTLQLKVAALS